MINKTVGTFLFILGLGLLSSCSNKSDSSAIVFMNNVKVFEGFDMKKDYDKRMEAELINDANQLDSIEAEINSIGIVSDTLEVFQLRKTYYALQQQYEKKFQSLSTQYTLEVNNRLNEYIKSFAAANNYEMILGSGGEGNVMFVKDGLDVTDDLIKHINQVYNK